MKLVRIGAQYSDLFNLRDEESKGRTMILLNNFLCCIANIFVTGTFYTAFLTDNGIDIVSVGIIGFIPYIAWIFSLISPSLLSKFKRRRGLLLFNHLFYHTCIVLATTVMPRFVSDPRQKTLWFGLFLLMGHISNSLLGSGTMAWHINFLPNYGPDRERYFSAQNMITAIFGTLTAVIASSAADLLAGSPNRAAILVALRFISFVIFVVSGLMLYLVPIEYPYPKRDTPLKLSDIITEPVACKPFLLIAIIAMLWNVICNVNGSTWLYYVLNTVGVGYVFTYTGSAVNAICNILLIRWWRKLINFHSWYTMLLVTVFLTGLMELPISFSTAKTPWVYVLVSVIQGFISVGTNQVFASMFYINLPKDHADTDVFITFWNFTINVSVLLGSMFGTWFLAQIPGSYNFLGLPFYGSQFLTMIKFVLFMGLSLFIKKIMPRIRIQ